MTNALAVAVDIITKVEVETSPAAIGQAYFDALHPLGLRALFARAYTTLPIGSSAEAASASREVLSRISPAGWENAYEHYQLDRSNPVTRGARERSAGFIWSEVDTAARTRAGWQGWHALDEFGFADGMAVPVHGPDGYCAAMSMGFERIDLRPVERRAIELAAIALHDRLRATLPLVPRRSYALTPRERDSLAFVAEGKSDWEIGVILGISQTTAHAHVEAAKRKLGARTRAQAVARLLRAGGL